MISVFTPTNDISYLHIAYNSLQAQTYEDWEWIVLINGLSDADDGTTLIPFFNDSRVKVFHTTQTGVIGTLKRIACSKCIGEYIVELDHDDELMPTCLEEISNCKEDFVYSNYIQVDQNWNPYIWGSDNGWSYRNVDYKGMVLPEIITPYHYPMNFARPWFAALHVRAWKRDFYWSIGGHSDMKISDDHDLVCRTFLYGSIKYIDKPLYIYRIHGNNSVIKMSSDLQETIWEVYDSYSILMQEKWARENDLQLVDLGGRFNSRYGYTTYDRYDSDIIGDLDGEWQLESDSVGIVRAHNIIEHLKDPIHTMNESWRVLAHGGVMDIIVPSTNGAGAWCDPTHVSFWNINSFNYYTDTSYRRYIEPECVCRFQVSRLTEIYIGDIPFVNAHLISIKDDGVRYHGELNV